MMPVIETREKIAVPNKSYRVAMLKLKKAMQNHPGYHHRDDYPLKHSFAEGLYIRRLLIPQGHLGLTFIHKCSYPFFMMAGDATIIQADGNIRMKAPQSFITEAGTQRVIFSHVDSVFATVHTNPENERDIDVIEKRIFADYYDTFIDVDEDELGLIEDLRYNDKELDMQTKEVLSDTFTLSV